jgi:hypothetical protein
LVIDGDYGRHRKREMRNEKLEIRREEEGGRRKDE